LYSFRHRFSSNLCVLKNRVILQVECSYNLIRNSMVSFCQKKLRIEKYKSD